MNSLAGEIYEWDRRADKGSQWSRPGSSGKFQQGTWLVDGKFRTINAKEIIAHFDFGHIVALAIVDVHVDDPTLTAVAG